MDQHDNNLGVLETEKDAGKGQEGVHKFWMLELEAADKVEMDFRDEADDVTERYQAEEADIEVSHNILFSNVETMRPALYDSTPVPNIRRRFRDQDPIGKEVSEVMERAASYQLEANDMDSIMEQCVLDMLLPGRGIARLNYEPSFRTIPEENIPFNPPIVNTETGLEEFQLIPEREVISDEKVNILYVPWRNFRMSPARTWGDVRWVCFDWYLTKRQLKNMFPGKNVPLDAQTEESHHPEQEFEKVPSVFKRAYVREIWDKQKKQVIFIAPSFKQGPLRVDDDPLNLKDFFPMPKPLYSIETTDSMVPIPEFRQYVTQAKELDLITKRISGLIKGLRLRGVYDSTLEELGKISQLGDNEYIPVENANQWRDSGGIEKAFMTMPIEQAAKVLSQLYLQRDQIKDVIFEITGLSDIIRGVSNAHETATAQNIKSQFGSLRISRKQREVQRFARDIIRIMVEIMAENFQPETLSRITQRQIVPEMMQIMTSDELRAYRIDIETDSTIAKQIQDEEENFSKLLNAIGQFVTMVAPLVAQGFFPMNVAVSLLQSGIRRFKMGRSVEDAFASIDVEAAQAQIDQANQQPQSDPEAEIKQAELQLKTQEIQAKLQSEAQMLALKQEEQQSDISIDQQKLQLEIEKANAMLQLEQAKAGLEREKAIADLSLTKEKNTSDLKFKEDSVSGVMKEDFMAEIEDKLTQVVTALAQVSQNQSEAIVQAVNQMSEAVEQLSKPKKIVKDKSGRPIGVKTVEDV